MPLLSYSVVGKPAHHLAQFVCIIVSMMMVMMTGSISPFKTCGFEWKDSHARKKRTEKKNVLPELKVWLDFLELFASRKAQVRLGTEPG